MSVHLGASELSACHVSMMPPYRAQRELPSAQCIGNSVSEKNSSRQLGEYRGRLLSDPRPKHPLEKAKIVHLAHVLSFAWLHNIALWSHNPPGKAGEKGGQSICLKKRTRPSHGGCVRRFLAPKGTWK